MLLGIAANEPNVYNRSTMWQPMAIPANARTMRVNVWTYQAAEPGSGPDKQLMLVYDIDPAQNLQGQRSPIGTVFNERVNAQAWQLRTFNMDVSAYRSRTLWLYASAVNDGQGGRVWMTLDDIEVIVCP